jgi:phage-related protein
VRAIAAVMASELSKDIVFSPLMVTLRLNAGYKYYTDCDKDVWYGGNQYQARGMDFFGTSMALDTEVASTSITIDDVTGEFMSILMNDDPRKKIIEIGTAALDVYYQPIGYAVIFIGIIDSAALDDSQKACRLDIMSPSIFWQKETPAEMESISCPYRFKGDDCEYTGSETWCNQTYGRCDSIGNIDNFGGNPFLGALVSTEIYWGKSS